MSSTHFARALRLRRLFRHHPERLLVVPLDHSITCGPVVPRGTPLDRLVARLAESGVDAIVIHKGGLRHIEPNRFAGMSLIVHLSASTEQAADPDAKYLVTGVEEAVRLGADAVSVHVNLGSLDEQRQIGDLGAVAALCDRWNLPLMAMAYARGPRISESRDPRLVLHAATLAADLGADLVKTEYVGSAAEMAGVTAACPIPLIVAGGPQLASTGAVLAFVRAALDGGAAGVAMGRNIFQAPDPGDLASRVAALVHERREPELDQEKERRGETVLA